MAKSYLDKILIPYNPWWESTENYKKWKGELPDYHRPVVSTILSDLKIIKQVISITGPRRVGKSTAVMQVIKELLEKQNIPPENILYFSFDDPTVFQNQNLQQEIFDLLINRIKQNGTLYYYFLDEIQRLPKWELFIKKYYDLKYPVKFIVSGSASSPIFRSSQESLLGRIKDHHLLPFSFREYCQYQFREYPEFHQILSEHNNLRDPLLNGDGNDVVKATKDFIKDLKDFDNKIGHAAIDYCINGGFPEVWQLPNPVQKIEYLMEQQIRKVLYEDLMMLTKYRKPENILRFFIYLLSQPGNEINITKIANETGVKKNIVTDNLPKLEMTDLILRIQKFSHKPLRARQGNIKCYPVDMALRNAVLKNWELPDEQTMGVMAENLVIRELITWPEKIEISYYRNRNKEVDFVMTYGGNKYLPIEVKNRRKSGHISALGHFTKKYGIKTGVIIHRSQNVEFKKYLRIPLRYFLLGN